MEGVPLGNFLDTFPDFSRRVSGDLHGQVHCSQNSPFTRLEYNP